MPGPRDPLLTPYVVEPERAIAGGLYKRVVMVTAAQTGKTDAILDVAGQRLDQRPGPILYVGPNKQFLSEQFEPRVMALLDEAPTLTAKVARGKRMTKTRKIVAGVPFRLAHSGSSTALKSDPAVLALVDEYDEMRDNVNQQGGPLGLVERRGDTYADFVCVVTSTPKRGRVAATKDENSGLCFWDVAVSEDIESPIWQLWQQGTRHHWCWPCPHCGEYFVPRFNLLRFPLKARPLQAARETFLECPHCGGVIEDRHKTEMNARGRYAAPGQNIDKSGVVHGEPAESKAISFWVSGLASPFVSFGERVATLVEAQQSGDDAMVQQAINAGFGELYSPGGGEVPEWMEIKEKSRQATYQRREVPADVMYLTLACDVQRHSIPWAIRGWGARATSWLIDYGYLRGDTSEEDIWAALGDLVTEPVGGMAIRLAFIDSGFRPGKTDTLPLNRVYEFCRRFPRRVRPTKGSSAPMRTPLLMSKIEVSRKDGRAAKFGLDLVRLDTDHWKSWVHERLRWPDDHIGGWHVFRGVDDDYCHQLVSEARLKQPTGRVEWVQRSRDNHFFDCFDPATELLTMDGWVPVASAQPDMQFATVNLAADLIEYQKPTNIIERQHAGEMVRIRGRRIDMLVTPNHRMVTCRSNPIDDTPRITEAADLTIWHRIKLTAGWRGIEVQTIDMPANKREPAATVEADDLFELLGWFVSNGHLRRQSDDSWTIVLSQTPRDKIERIMSLLRRLPWPMRMQSERQIVVTSRQVYDLCESCLQPGDGRGGYRTQVPRLVKDASTRLIARFVEAAILGDGWHQGKFRTYATTSRKMADDMQELFIKIGNSGNIVIVDPGNYNILGRSGETVEQYHVSEPRTKAASLRQSDNSPIFERVPYEGPVHCVSVPNGTLIARRNGKACVVGNCEAMQAAAGYLLNVQRIPLQNKKEDTKEGVGRKPETPSEVTEAPPIPLARGRGRRIIRSSYLGA